MKIKRIKKLRVNSYDFKVIWDKDYNGAGFSYTKREMRISLKTRSKGELFQFICHELMEIVAIEMNVRHDRHDCETDYIFVYDHRQHETMMNMFAGLLRQFIK